jgi:hypothetical protein
VFAGGVSDRLAGRRGDAQTRGSRSGTMAQHVNEADIFGDDGTRRVGKHERGEHSAPEPLAGERDPRLKRRDAEVDAGVQCYEREDQGESGEDQA